MSRMTVTIAAAPAFSMRLQAQTNSKAEDDDRRSRSPPETRRRVQNRVNQRAFRMKRAAEKAAKTIVFDLEPASATASQPSSEHTSARMSPSQRSQPTVKVESPPASPSIDATPSASFFPSPVSEASWCAPFESLLKSQSPALASPSHEANPSEKSDTVLHEESYLSNLQPRDLHHMPADDHLLSLMYYNVFRALTRNIRLLGLNPLLMHTSTYRSPFNNPSTDISAIPPNLRPTEMQRKVIHHPCFDIFPDPVVRENAIRGSHILTLGTLCMTLAGRNSWYNSDRRRRNGFLIWGPPEEAGSWEVTEGFLECWSWLVRGSTVLEESTNKWRAKRGEEAISFA